MASDSAGGLGVELEHHVPAGGALQGGVYAPLQGGAGERAWWRHGQAWLLVFTLVGDIDKTNDILRDLPLQTYDILYYLKQWKL